MERTYFLDNLRSLMIIIIVIFHSALSYTTDIVPWWYVTDRNDHQLFDVFILILDYFQLPVLFLIAGFFSISSIEKHGTKAFIITKIRKLIIPLVLLSILYTPVMLFIRYALNTKNPVGYVDYLSSYLPTLSDAGIVVLNQATALKQANSFSVVHLWFISVLFIFFCITGTAYKFFKNKEQSSARTVKPYFPAFIIGGFSISLLIAVITPGFFDWEWVKAGSFVMLAPARLPVYAGMFILGIYGYKNRWFINKIPGSPWKWCVLSVFLSVLLLGCSKVIWETRDNTFAISLAHGFLRSFAALSWFCFFLNLSKKYMNKTSTFLKFIHKHSYETYLLHLPIVIVLQLVLLKSSLPVGIKFILVSIGSIALTLVFSSVFYKRVQLFFENFSFTESEKELCRSGAKG